MYCDARMPGGRVPSLVSSIVHHHRDSNEAETSSILTDCSSGGSEHKVSSSSYVSANIPTQHGGCKERNTAISSKAAFDIQNKRESSSDQMPHSTGIHKADSHMDSGLCQVCQDVAAGFYCGAFVCEACKKFFIRASKQEKQKFVCLRQGQCKITKESRVQCQYCRYQKCLQINMYYPGEGKRTVSSLRVQGIPCRVCGAPSSGFHFGALTCEGCKGFFRRMVKEREPGTYKCSSGGSCEISTHTRNMCKACRYNKCIGIGMSVEGSRIGRQPNAVKHAISMEVKKQCKEQSLNSLPSCVSGAGEPCSSSTGPAVSCDSAVSNVCHGAWKQGTLNPSSSPLIKVKQEEHSPDISLSDVQLSEVSMGIDIKEECRDEDLEEQMLTASLEEAGKELAHMCMVERRRSGVFDESLFQTHGIMWKKMMQHFEFHTQCSLRFAKKVPGYRQLPLDDQVVLMQNSIYPMVVLSHSRKYELETGFYNYFNFSEPEEKRIVQKGPEFQNLQPHFIHMGQMAQTMKLTDMEYTLLACMLLFDTDCPGLQSVEQVEQLQDHIIRFFQDYECRVYADGISRFGEMMLRLSELSLVRAQHQQTITNFLSSHPELEVPQLFKEMFF